MTQRARLTMFLTCAAAVAAALETAGARKAPARRQTARVSQGFEQRRVRPFRVRRLAARAHRQRAGHQRRWQHARRRRAARKQRRARHQRQPDDNSLYNAGAVYVYVRRGDAWTQQAYIKASNAGGSDMFGLSLALSRDGNTLAVAAPWEASAATGVNGNQNDDSIPQAGAVYIFTRTGNRWSQHAYSRRRTPAARAWATTSKATNSGFRSP